MNRTNLIPGRPLRSLASLLLLAVMAGCSHEQFEAEDLPTGKFRVEVSLSGVAGGISPWRTSGSSATPPSPLAQDYRPSAAPAPVPDHWSRAITRAGEGTTLPYERPWTDYEQHDLSDQTSSFYNGNKTHPLPKGETLRLIACNKQDGTIIEQKTYVVGEDDNLYPCTVNPDGSLKDRGSTPLYLTAGDYFFYALSPARELDGDNEIGLLVDNGEYLLSNDWRYKQTVPTELTESDFPTDNKVIRLTLRPVINQTARLKFSLYTDDQDLHNLQPSDAGLSVSGLQVPYKDGITAKDQCNWTVGDTLRMAYGHKDAEDIAFAYTRETINVPTVGGSKEEKEALVITTAILPTDATSQPLVVMFRGKLNGIPSTYSMMLNEKTFRAGHSYNYVGKVRMKGGVAAIEWQVVTWDSDIYIGTGNGDAGTGGIQCPDTEQ